MLLAIRFIRCIVEPHVFVYNLESGGMFMVKEGSKYAVGELNSDRYKSHKAVAHNPMPMSLNE